MTEDIFSTADLEEDVLKLSPDYKKAIKWNIVQDIIKLHNKEVKRIKAEVEKVLDEEYKDRIAVDDFASLEVIEELKNRLGIK